MSECSIPSCALSAPHYHRMTSDGEEMIATVLKPLTPTEEPKSKGGRPKGYSGLRSKMPSAVAQRFKKAGLIWENDFAAAIKANDKERIQLWLKLLPYMITTSHRAKGKRLKGKPSRAAIKALEALESAE